MSKTFYQGLGKSVEWPNFDGSLSLTFNDVLLVPRNTDIESRSDVDTSVKLGPYQLTIPIMPSPMDTVTGDTMVRKLAQLGAIGTLTRDDPDRLTLCEAYSKENIPCIYSVGQKNGFEEAKLLIERGAKVILIDAANGGTKTMKELAQKIKSSFDVTIIAGNITTYEQALDYKKYGIDIARVGIGGGGLCTTRLKTGVGMAQLSAIFETTAARIPVIADGGIKYPGDVAKALAAGATYVMAGSIFGKTQEAPGDVTIDESGKKRKTIRGQASAEYMKAHNIKTTHYRTAEGVATTVAISGSVEDLVNDITGGLRSSMSYVGAKDLKEFREKSMFTQISSATLQENKAHTASDRQ